MGREQGMAGWRRLALALAVTFGAALVPRAAAQEVAEVGKAPPHFALPDENGELYDLNDFIGRPTILYFTHNMCHYCTQIIAFLKRAHAKYEGTDLAIITLNVWADDERFIRRYKEQFGLPFAMLAGKNAELLRNYEVNYVPIVVFIGRDGKIRYIYHHYVLQVDFERSTAEIVEEAQQ